MARSKFLVPIKRSGSQSPVFIVPSAGTTVYSLVHLGRKLTTDRPVLAFEFTELPKGDGKPATVEQVADYCIEEMRQASPNGPYVIAGHCWGGITAFAIAARLEAASETVAGVYVLESLPPGSAEESDREYPGERAEKAKALDAMLAKVQENLDKLPADQAKRFGPPSWELIDIARRYRPSNRISAPIRLLRTETHPKTVFQSWKNFTTGGFAEQIMAGDAFSMVAQPLVGTLCLKLDAAFRADGV